LFFSKKKIFFFFLWKCIFNMSSLLLLFFIISHRLLQIWIWFKTVNLLITCVQIHITYASKNDYICTNIVQLCKYPSHVPPWEISEIIYLNTEEILVQYLITFLVSHQYWQTPYKNHAVNPSTSSISYYNLSLLSSNHLKLLDVIWI
jgi:hypothetical protein